jgi:hypothetical protein
LNERQRQLFVSIEVQALGYGGITAVSEVCGLSLVNITNGIKDLFEPHLDGYRIRKSGGGRPSLASLDPAPMEDIRPIMESTTIGKSESSVL